MSSPLLNIDANARPADSKPARGSKIPSPPAAQNVGSTGYRSLFSVSAKGSPRYTAVSPPPKTAVPPPVTSKLPRKSYTSTHVPTIKTVQHGAGQRSSLPTRGVRTSLAQSTPAYSVRQDS